MTLPEAFWFAIRCPWYRKLMLASLLVGFITGVMWTYEAQRTWLDLAADAAAYAEEQR